MQINRFKTTFNYKKIEENFIIYKIEKVGYKNYAQFFNQIKDEIKEALSIIYVDYTVYILTKKIINPYQTELSIKKQNIQNLENKEFILLKLLVYGTNSIKEKKVILDTDGIFYIVKASKRVYETVLINILKDDNQIIFKLNAKNFVKKTYDSKYKEKRNKYIEKNSTLIRVKKGENPKSYFVKQKKIDGYNQSSVDYLKTDVTKKFETKLYTLIRFFKNINKNLKDYISIELDELNFDNFELKRSQIKRTDEIDNLIKEKLSKEKKGLVVEDFIQDNRSQKFIDEVKNIIENKYNSIVTLGKIKNSKSSFNLFVTEEKGSENDPYDDIKSLLKATQNILLKNLENPKIILPVLLKELIVKQDIFNKKLSIPNYKDSQKITFYYFKKRKEEKDKYNIYKMVIENENIELDEVKHSESLFEKDEKNYIQEMLFETSQNNNEPELIIENENGDVNFITKTNYFPIPNIEHVTKEYKELEKPFIKSYNQLLKLRDNVPKDRQVEYIEFLETIEDKEKINLRIKVKNKKVKNYLAEKFNVNLSKNLNRSRKENTVLDVLTGIKYSKIDKKNAYYVVGTKEIASSFPRANVIRKIEAHKGKLLLDDLLVMMDEYFVKNKELTVLPYPLKYLREYSEMKK